MSCKECKKLSVQHEELIKAISDHDNPLKLLHSIVTILMPDQATAANLMLINDTSKSQTPQKTV